jgi:DNA-binding LytR/AlgR family response regulator
MILKCVAIDDEPLSLNLVREYIGRIPRVKLIQTFDDAIAGAEFLRNHDADILLIDINMPDITGLDLVRSLPGKPLTIFITAHKKFAFEGFELEAIDYLLKPVSFERFRRAIEKAVEFHEYRTNPAPGLSPSLFVRSEYKMVRIPLKDIEYIEGLKDYIKIHISNSKPVLTLMTMKAILEKLPEDQFIRIHRSFIIPLDKIKSVRNRTVLLTSSAELPISDSYIEAFNSKLKK